MQVKDVMTTTPATVQARASIREAIRLMLARSISGPRVVNAAKRLSACSARATCLGELDMTRS